MYCENCGKKVDKDSYTCPECGYVLDKNKKGAAEVDYDEKEALRSVNTLFIVGFIFSLFCGSIFGLLITIVGFIKAANFKEEYNKKVPLVKLGIASIIIFIAFIALSVLMFTFTSKLSNQSNEYMIGKWNCGVEDKIEFTDKKVIVTSSSTLNNKSMEGIYSINSTVILKDTQKYKITIKPSTDELRNIQGKIIIKNNASIITIDSKVYNCVKE